MKKIQIPFTERMAIAALEGTKTMTTRNEAYGQPGDTFVVLGRGGLPTRYFVLLEVRKVKLRHVAQEWFDEEGFDNSAQFIKYWEKLHPRVGYTPDKEVFTHVFAMSDQEVNDVASPAGGQA